MIESLIEDLILGLVQIMSTSQSVTYEHTINVIAVIPLCCSECCYVPDSIAGYACNNPPISFHYPSVGDRHDYEGL